MSLWLVVRDLINEGKLKKKRSNSSVRQSNPRSEGDEEDSNNNTMSSTLNDSTGGGAALQLGTGETSGQLPTSSTDNNNKNGNDKDASPATKPLQGNIANHLSDDDIQDVQSEGDADGDKTPKHAGGGKGSMSRHSPALLGQTSGSRSMSFTQNGTTPRGITGRSSFRSGSLRFPKAAGGAVETAHIDAPPISATSYFGKGPKASFTKAQDRFKVAEVATVQAQSFYVPRFLGGGSCDHIDLTATRATSPNKHGGGGGSRSPSCNSTSSQNHVPQYSSNHLGGSGDRFAERPVATVNAPLYEARSTIVTKKSFRSSQAPMQTAPRFGPAQPIQGSQTSDFAEATSKIDFYVPPGIAQRCSSANSLGGRHVMTSAKRFADPAKLTQNIDVAEDVVGSSTLHSKKRYVPGCSSFRSSAPRFTKTKEAAAQKSPAYVPKSFVDEILSK